MLDLENENRIHYLKGRGHWMYVCVCKAVTDKEVRAAIEGGAETVCQVTAACAAGGDCGACKGMIQDMIDETKGCSLRKLPVLQGEAA
jgi:bacterioferritin-associated ferredoxin